MTLGEEGFWWCGLCTQGAKQAVLGAEKAALCVAMYIDSWCPFQPAVSFGNTLE